MDSVTKPDDEAAAPDGELERLGCSLPFTAELLRLSELAPQPAGDELYALALTGRRAA